MIGIIAPVDASDGGQAGAERTGLPPRRVRLTGRAMNATVARAPFLWPLLRPAMRSLCEGMAQEWSRRDRDAAEYLARLAPGLLHVSPEPERALDVGTGTGAAALLVAREFPQARVRGVDLAEGMIEQAKKRIGLDPEGRVAFKVADAAHLPWLDDSFDLVTML